MSDSDMPTAGPVGPVVTPLLDFSAAGSRDRLPVQARRGPANPALVLGVVALIVAVAALVVSIAAFVTA